MHRMHTLKMSQVNWKKNDFKLKTEAPQMTKLYPKQGILEEIF